MFFSQNFTIEHAKIDSKQTRKNPEYTVRDSKSDPHVLYHIYAEFASAPSNWWSRFRIRSPVTGGTLVSESCEADWFDSFWTMNPGGSSSTVGLAIDAFLLTDVCRSPPPLGDSSQTPCRFESRKSMERDRVALVFSSRTVSRIGSRLIVISRKIFFTDSPASSS